MKLLAIETATRRLGVAVIDGPERVEVGELRHPAPVEADRILIQLEAEGERAHGGDLPLLVEQALRDTQLTLQDLHGLVVDIGPGSFTGLRIGAAYIKGLAMASRLPVVTVCSLDAIAENAAKDEERSVCTILDAKQQKVYFARYVFRGPREYRQSPALLPIADVIVRCSGAAPTYFLGDGIVPYREALVGALGERAQFGPEDEWYPRVSTAARLGIVALRAGKQVDASTLVPMYLYPWDCSIKGGKGTTETLPQPPHIEVHP